MAPSLATAPCAINSAGLFSIINATGSPRLTPACLNTETKALTPGVVVAVGQRLGLEAQQHAIGNALRLLAHQHAEGLAAVVRRPAEGGAHADEQRQLAQIVEEQAQIHAARQ